MRRTSFRAWLRRWVTLAAATATVLCGVLVVGGPPAAEAAAPTYAVTPVSVGTNPFEMAVNPTTNKVYVTNAGDGTVSVIDGGTNAVTPVTVGPTPFAVAVNATTNKVYVTNASFAGTVSVIDGLTNAVTPVTVGVSPQGVAVDATTNKVYVTNTNGNTVSVIDGLTNAVTSVTVGTNPGGVAVDATTNKVYVTNVSDGTVSVIDGLTNAVTSVTVGTTPAGVAVDATTNKVYVTNNGDNTVSVIDGLTNAVTSVTVGASPQLVAVDPTTNKVYVTNNGDNTVSVIDGLTNAVTSVTVGASPEMVAVDPTTNKVYVTNNGDNTVSVIDGLTNAVTSVTVGTAPQMVAIDATTNKVYVVNTADGTVSVIAEVAVTAPIVTPSTVVSRVAGPDRYATAVAASTTEFPGGGAGAVVLAAGTDYPDALVGVPLAAAKSAPLLLTTGTVLPAVTRTEIVRVLPAGGTVYVLGNTAAVPAGIATQLGALGYTVDRLGGADRYATAVKVADALGDPSTVLLASGENYPDALAGGPAAAKAGGAILLTAGATLGPTTTAYLGSHPGTVYAIGGPAVAADPAATPLAGADRYTTAGMVAARFFPAPSHVGVATGNNYPDALSGGALVAANTGPVLLADTGHTDAATSYLTGVRAGVGTAWFFGDTNAVPATVAGTLTTTLNR